jgi:class 3 adenylate cyclase/predicted ATPase
MLCPKCALANPKSAAFCGHCGSSLDRDRPIPEADAQYVSLAERRQLTVMFCDLVGSTELSGQLDPEELHDLTRQYQSVCAEVIGRHAGHVAQFMGDGLLAYFGYPVAHEDDAQRAVRAGLEIVAALSRLRTRLAKSLHVRVAIHTGLVVVGQLGDGSDPNAMTMAGETVNIAARLQSIAEPGTVIISAPTFRLIEGFFLCRSLGAHTLKGVAAPIELHSVLEESGIQSRFEQAVAAGLTTFVSRETEVALLVERWERARNGSGQVVLLSGEAGIGKSRLMRALKERTTGEAITDLAARCSSYYQDSALYPIIGSLQYFLQFQREDSAETKLTALEHTLDDLGFPLPETVPLLAALLSLPFAHRYPPLAMTPQRHKQKTLETLVACLLKEAERHPTRVVVEDVHWADPSTLEFLGLLIEQVSQAHLFVALVFRSEFLPPWRSQTQVTSITVGRLSRAATESIIESIAGGKKLPPHVICEIVEKTEGVPLFVEELTRMVIESGLLREQDDHYEMTGPLTALAIPSTLYESLMARLDRLGGAKEIAQIAATIGKEFSYELLQAVAPLDETKLTGALNRLVDAELLNQDLLSPQTQYSFRHALIRDAAYESLLRSKRRQYHRKIAEVLRERFFETAEAQPELLASHFAEAGMIDEAIPYWQRAGQRALERSANQEAIRHLTKGLELLSVLPETDQHVQQELLLRASLGPALIATKGFASPEVEAVYARARKLCEKASRAPQLFPVLWGLWVFYLARAEYGTARQFSEQCLKLGESSQDPDLLLEANHALGVTFLGLAEHTSGLEYLERAVALYDRAKIHAATSLFGQDPGVVCLSHSARALWFLGYPDRALKRNADAIALATKLSHKYSLAAALSFSAWLNQLNRNHSASQEHAEAAIELSVEQGFPFWQAMGLVLRGWTQAQQGRSDEGIADILLGLNAYETVGAKTMQPCYLGLLADAYGKGGRPSDGLNALAEAVTAVNQTGERYYEAELYRLKGELTLNQCEAEGFESKYHPEVEESYLRALNIARQQGAKSLELRAATSLSRLWQKQGKRTEAQQLLSTAYRWFTEGFGSKDLRDASILLEELS